MSNLSINIAGIQSLGIEELLGLIKSYYSNYCVDENMPVL